MTPAEYLDACREKIAAKSDYELLRKLGDDERHSTGYRSGKRAIPLATQFKIAITLELDPAQVVADLEGQREKNDKRAAFWRSFTLRAQKAAAIVLCTLALSYSAISGDAAKLLGGLAVAASAAYVWRRRCA